MRRSLLLFSVFIFGYCLMIAQTADINKIKKSRNYITAQAASSVSLDDASEIARTTLNLEIEQWLKERGENDIAGYVAKSKENISVINTRRGSIFRSFVYVRKKEILPYYQDEDVVMDSATTASIVSAQPVPEPQQNVDTLKTSVAVTETPDIVINIAPTFVITEAEKEMLDVRTFDGLETYLKSKMSAGKLDKDNMGKYATMPSHTSCHVFIYNRQGEIPACLRVTQDDIRNLRTGEKDAIQNYSGCGAMWFILNK